MAKDGQHDRQGRRNSGSEPIIRPTATINPQTAIGIGFAMTARTEVWMAS